ncbi:hypothetical protein ANCCEY_04383 [Ancylostoma ceylanicum]|uniref:Transmembrane protein 17B n=1 Tax=Ancylostoma ceylanicum TaxID=53326 RepID=A0A0D6M9L4_9BILA|nr:hypothetical protein ANCCEY_04383 [Ancylostoma ceylanicum]
MTTAESGDEWPQVIPLPEWTPPAQELTSLQYGPQYTYLSVTYKVILVAVLIVYILVEVVRLLLAFVGNLGEKIPAMSGFWTLTLILQFPILLFLLFNSAVAPVPLETVVLIVHVLFIITEIVAGFIAMRTMAAQQIKLFKAMIEETRK